MNTNRKRVRRSNEELATEALKYTRKVDFQHKSNAHYKQAWRKGSEFLNKICSHMDIEWELKWETIESVQLEAYKYSSRTSFARKSVGAYDRAQTMGWLDIVCSFMDKKSNEEYSYEEIELEAKKFKSKKEFRKASPGIWEAAYKRADYNEICSHMDVLWKPKWGTFEQIRIEALKYNSRTEFKLGSSGAWDAAIRLNILDRVCSHMKLSRNSSIPETDLFAIIKSIWPKAQKIKDRKVKIEGKPHIHGFDIDIYIPELRKGIEFDGKYWHSNKGLKRGRPNWSDEDIGNYPKIKKAWFASKGIELFHINERDWDIDKEKCVRECLVFLGSTNVEKIA